MMADPTLHGPSLWAASASVPCFEASPLEMERPAELAIIGGGFTGLSAALHAAELGCDVVVLEAEAVGFGASGRNGGQVNPGVKLDEAALVARFGAEGRGLFRLGQEAPDFLADLVARKGLNCRFERRGLIRLAHNRRALTTARSRQGCPQLKLVEPSDEGDPLRLLRQRDGSGWPHQLGSTMRRQPGILVDVHPVAGPSPT
jgi:glycine/D-amino acid oxidase-like deaminating enzyme